METWLRELLLLYWLLNASVLHVSWLCHLRGLYGIEWKDNYEWWARKKVEGSIGCGKDTRFLVRGLILESNKARLLTTTPRFPHSSLNVQIWISIFGDAWLYLFYNLIFFGWGWGCKVSINHCGNDMILDIPWASGNQWWWNFGSHNRECFVWGTLLQYHLVCSAG